jgi:Cu(I)/Ag(I) efflux system membrane fusion protein
MVAAIWAGVAFAAPMLACADGSHSAAPSVAAAQAKPPASHQPAEIARATPAGKVVLAYLDVHKSLAVDDAAQAQTHFEQVRDAARAAGAMSDPAIRQRVIDSAQVGAVAKDLAAARAAFATLSRALLDWLRVQPNPVSETLHVANCPMAFGTGAKWLQASDKIENPYYGSEMPTCGSIDAALKPGAKSPLP